MHNTTVDSSVRKIVQGATLSKSNQFNLRRRVKRGRWKWWTWK